MARETKVGLLIGVGLILLIAIIVNDVLVASKTTQEPAHMTTFAEAAQDELAQTPARDTQASADRTPAADHRQIILEQANPADARQEDATAAHQRFIPTAEELRSADLDARQRALPPRSAQGLHAAMQIDGAEQQAQLAADQPRHREQTTRHAAQERRILDPARDTAAQEAAARSLRHDPPSRGQVIHYVAANEAMWDIADKYLGHGSKWKLIAAANPDQVDSQGRVNAGARLVIPTQTAVIAAATQQEPGYREIDVTPRGAQVPSLYTVKSGDSLYKIAQAALGDGNRYHEIAALNGLADANAIRVGMKLKLPAAAQASPAVAQATTREPAQPRREAAAAPRTYTVKPGDNLTRIARATLGDGSRYDEIFRANRDALRDENDLSVGQVLKIPG